MKIWEYSCVALPQFWDEVDEGFQDLGKRGWEMVSVCQNPGSDQLIAFFKREKEGNVCQESELKTKV